ncbi:MAG: hypothetical protein ACM3PY_01575 [Omnitrophica WOR_2 bacterium]
MLYNEIGSSAQNEILACSMYIRAPASRLALEMNPAIDSFQRALIAGIVGD